MVQRWQPDENLVPAARLGQLNATKMSASDRTWAIVGLTALEIPASQIAELMHCSIRLVKQIRNDPLGDMAAHAVDLNQALEDQRRETRLKTAYLNQQLEHRIEEVAMLRNREFSIGLGLRDRPVGL